MMIDGFFCVSGKSIHINGNKWYSSCRSSKVIFTRVVSEAVKIGVFERGLKGFLREVCRES